LSIATLSGHDVITATVILPRVGRWMAYVEVVADTLDGLEGAVILDLGEVKLKGTASRSGVFAQSVTLLVVGGASHLYRTVGPRAFLAGSVGVVLQALADDVGERLAATCDPQTMATALPRWLRRERLAYAEIQSIAEAAGPDVGWRFLRDGTLWMGRESWPVTTLAHDLLSETPTNNSAVIGTEQPQLQPGVTFNGRRVEEVQYLVGAEQIRTVVVFQGDSSAEANPSQETQRLGLFVARETDHARLLEVHPCRVVAQNADGTLELQPDDDTMPGLSQVPLRTPWPGVSFKVAPGSRVQVLCPRGEPSAQVSALWEPDQGSTLQLDLQAAAINLGDATAPVGRVGDAVTIDPALAAWITAVQVALNGLGVTIAPPFVGPTIGTIAAGSPKVKA